MRVRFAAGIWRQKPCYEGGPSASIAQPDLGADGLSLCGPQLILNSHRRIVAAGTSIALTFRVSAAFRVRARRTGGWPGANRLRALQNFQRTDMSFAQESDLRLRRLMLCIRFPKRKKFLVGLRNASSQQ